MDKRLQAGLLALADDPNTASSDKRTAVTLVGLPLTLPTGMPATLRNT